MYDLRFDRVIMIFLITVFLVFSYQVVNFSLRYKKVMKISSYADKISNTVAAYIQKNGEWGKEEDTKFINDIIKEYGIKKYIKPGDIKVTAVDESGNDIVGANLRGQGYRVEVSYKVDIPKWKFPTVAIEYNKKCKPKISTAVLTEYKR